MSGVVSSCLYHRVIFTRGGWTPGSKYNIFVKNNLSEKIDPDDCPYINGMCGDPYFYVPVLVIDLILCLFSIFFSAYLLRHNCKKYSQTRKKEKEEEE